jgi:hypothetical protein
MDMLQSCQKELRQVQQDFKESRQLLRYGRRQRGRCTAHKNAADVLKSLK